MFPALYDPNCAWYSSAYCSRCNKGYYIENYTCHEIDDNCVEFDYDSNKCKHCVGGKIAFGPRCQ